ncbi:hypothetical protein GWR56_19810 [Mucilaginibacter sp. 14171R-50]|uniref:hypothetical protein n=1 Tax=Mucilaginibacter sp. 14171R-50 TaxID=2703789 RepID=UPI00138CDDD2|nr:hypothetical protein [Mucilaginibacter sp. 14171R-50]QHS57680.1 hypothetical protein GWR56_19810 [Mucilaginibacter sp. 14171R-50]
MKKWFAFALIPFLLACTLLNDDWKELDLNAFKISIPKKWIYKEERGLDSFIGRLVISQKTSLSFDFSDRGYASNILDAEQEYILKKEWMRECYFCKLGINYTTESNLKQAKIDIMKTLGETDSSKVKLEPFPVYKVKFVRKSNESEKVKYPKADYVAEVIYKDSIVYIPIEIPAKIKMHSILIDTTDKYIIKTIWPKTPVKGITGIYIKGRNSNVTFNLVGFGLSAADQELALKAFKTIRIKE